MPDRENPVYNPHIAIDAENLTTLITCFQFVVALVIARNILDVSLPDSLPIAARKEPRYYGWHLFHH